MVPKDKVLEARSKRWRAARMACMCNMKRTHQRLGRVSVLCYETAAPRSPLRLECAHLAHAIASISQNVPIFPILLHPSHKNIAGTPRWSWATRCTASRWRPSSGQPSSRSRPRATSRSSWRRRTRSSAISRTWRRPASICRSRSGVCRRAGATCWRKCTAWCRDRTCSARRRRRRRSVPPWTSCRRRRLLLSRRSSILCLRTR
jgi:hypothetical protein